MTTPTDTKNQDAAERQAIKEIADEVKLLTKIHSLEIPEVALALKKAYRAGQASREVVLEMHKDRLTILRERDRHKNIRDSVCDELDQKDEELSAIKKQIAIEVTEKIIAQKALTTLREENANWPQRYDYSVKHLQKRNFALVEENERLKASESWLVQQRDEAQSNKDSWQNKCTDLNNQLAVEREKSKKLVEALNRLSVRIVEHVIPSIDDIIASRAIIKQYLAAHAESEAK